MRNASIETSKIINDIDRRLPMVVQDSLRHVTDVPVTEEIIWGSSAHFYFCHGGTMQNKVGWLHSIRGVTHTNKKFMSVAKGMIPPVEVPTTTYFVPEGLMIDDDPSSYTSMQLARKDQNYRFVAIGPLVRFVIDAFRNAESRLDA